MAHPSPGLRWGFLALFVPMSACGGSDSNGPTGPTTVTVTAVTVGVAGNAPAVIAPGDRLQLFAQAQQSDGTVLDVTNTAVWRSSNPVVATVSSGGTLSAALEGELDVSATYGPRSGSLHARVVNRACDVTLSPATVSFGALQANGSVTVTASHAECRWTVRSDASWLPFTYDPGVSGSGRFTYVVPGNNTENPRDANLIVTVTNGPAAVHAIHQDRPLGCVYSVSPERVVFGPGGGSGSFRVTTKPADCTWRILENHSVFNVRLTGPTTATGAATVTYTVGPQTADASFQYLVQGLSGLNPPGIHTIVVTR